MRKYICNSEEKTDQRLLVILMSVTHELKTIRAWKISHQWEHMTPGISWPKISVFF